MKIALSQIHPSPNPIRKTWDEEKMKELMWSLMEEGQVEPIGVRENGAGYVVVWGHRRVEAARRAIWKEIEASIVPNDEINNLIQAGIENLSSEDMCADDKAEWADRLIKLGLSQREISRRSTVTQSTLSQWLIAKKGRDSGLNAGVQNFAQDEGVKKISFVSRVLGDDFNAKQSVLNKASKDNLTQDEVKTVAEAYRDAPTHEVRQAILKTDIKKNDTSEAIIDRATDIVMAETSIPSLSVYPGIVAGYDGIKALGIGINILKHASKDPATARMILKQWRGYLVIRLAEIDAILEPTDA